MCHCPNVTFHFRNKSEKDYFKLSSFVSKILKEMMSDNRSRLEFCSELNFNELISPVIDISTANAESDQEKNGLLTEIGEILSTFASFDEGRQFILQKSRESSLERSQDLILHLVEFVCRGLENGPITLEVLSSFIFFLRQIYRTCDGLLFIEPYKIHIAISKTIANLAWYDTKLKKMSMEEWNTFSIDNMLNFASSPKGILLLQRSGLMLKCISHMKNRFCL